MSEHVLPLPAASSRRVPACAAQEPQQAVQKGQGMRRATGDKQIHRQDAGNPVVRLWRAGEQAAGNRAGAGRDHDLRLRHRVVRSSPGRAHVRRHRAGDQETIRVAGRGDELDPESARCPSRPW